MSNKQNILNGQQGAIVAEFAATYGIDPSEITFFTGESEPFFGYEASCVLLNKLTDIVDRDIEPVPSVSPDGISRRCRLVFVDGSSSYIGVANIGEKDDQDKDLSLQQLEWLADGRAIRGAIRAKGINLFKLHIARNDAQKATNGEFSGPAKSTRESLLGQVHVLGREAGLILNGDKSFWYTMIHNRYSKNSCEELGIEQLSDFAAFLRSIVPQANKASV